MFRLLVTIALLPLAPMVAQAVGAGADAERVPSCPAAPGRGQVSLPPFARSPEGLWFTRVGQGRPILFVHGWTMDHRDEAWDYEPIFRMVEGWQRVYVDLPGMGMSADTAIGDQAAILQRLQAFAAREFGDTPLAIAGTSAGAYLAQALALQRPTAGLLLRMPMTVPDDRLRDRDAATVLVGRVDSTREPASPDDAAIVQTRCYLESLARKERERVVPAQALANRELLDPVRSDPARYALPADASRAKVDAPALIIAGRQDASVGYRDAWRLVERYPRASYVALDRAEHGFPIDPANRALFEALVLDWLSRVDEAAASAETP